jgi:hypothetical protein
MQKIILLDKFINFIRTLSKLKGSLTRFLHTHTHIYIVYLNKFISLVLGLRIFIFTNVKIMNINTKN